jgi:hypothetical protein
MHRVRVKPTTLPSMDIVVCAEVDLGEYGEPVWSTIPGMSTTLQLLPAHHTYDRIDLLVDEGGVLTVYTGTPQLIPIAPALPVQPPSQQYRTILASIRIPASCTSVQEANIDQ